jgi:DNA-binding MarR family transcriptional regulator
MPATSLLDAREGRTQTDIVAAIAKLQFRDGNPPRQSDIDELLPVSKGAISNNCKKLVETDLVRETNESRYRIDEAELLALYREHVDRYLARESESGLDWFANEVAAYNETRTSAKRGLRSTFKDNDLLLDVLVAALVDALDDSRIQTIREVMLHADQLVRSAATHVLTNPKFEGKDDPAWQTVRPLFQLAVALDRVHAGLDSLADAHANVAEYLPGDTPAATMTTYFTNNT